MSNATQGALFPDPLPDSQPLLWEFYFANDRLAQGDYISPRFALPLMREHTDRFARRLRDAGCVDVFVTPFVAAGGWVGLTMSYRHKGEETIYSSVPRRIAR